MLIKIKIKNEIYRNIILHVVLNRREALREEGRLRAFENRVLRRISGPKRDEVTGDWRKLYNVELNDCYSSPSVCREIISRKLRWVGHLARIRGKYRCIRTVFWWRNLRERDYLEELGVDGKIILRWIFRKWDVATRTGIDLALDSNRWGALANGVMSLRIPQNAGNFLSS